MIFFNFKLSKDSFLSEPLSGTKIPFDVDEDYRFFITHYKYIEPCENKSIAANIDANPVSVFLLTLENSLMREYNEKNYPAYYIPISWDNGFPSLFMSLLEEDKGHIYYMDLETWQDYVMDEPEDIQIKAIKEHAIHVADSFTEFCGMLYLED